MKRKIDFTIYERDDERLLFRFYPRRSHVHSFDDNPPKNWNEVYKVYFSWAIIRQCKWSDGDNWETEVMYEEYFDECSALDQISHILKQISDKKNTNNKYEVYPFGDGTTFTIEEWLDFERKSYWKFTMFQSYTNKGYRFSLPEDELKKFADTIDFFLEYMLQHGEGI